MAGAANSHLRRWIAQAEDAFHAVCLVRTATAVVHLRLGHGKRRFECTPAYLPVDRLRDGAIHDW